MQGERGGLRLETLTGEQLVYHVADSPALSELWVTRQRSPTPLRPSRVPAHVVGVLAADVRR
jgi:hypothetical protein